MARADGKGGRTLRSSPSMVPETQASLSKRSQRSQLASGSGAATIVGSSSQAEPRVSIPMFTASASSTASKRRLRLRGTTAEVKVQPTNGSGAVALTRQRQQQQNGKVTTPSAAPAAAATGLSSPPGHSAVSRPRTVSKSGGTASGVKNNKQLSNKGSPLRARHDSVLVADSAEDDDGLFDGKGDVVPDNAFEQGGYWPAKRIIAERKMPDGLIEYQIEWEGVDPLTGRAWLPSWEPYTSPSEDLVAIWQALREKARLCLIQLEQERESDAHARMLAHEELLRQQRNLILAASSVVLGAPAVGGSGGPPPRKTIYVEEPRNESSESSSSSESSESFECSSSEADDESSDNSNDEVIKALRGSKGPVFYPAPYVGQRSTRTNLAHWQALMKATAVQSKVQPFTSQPFMIRIPDSKRRRNFRRELRAIKSRAAKAARDQAKAEGKAEAARAKALAKGKGKAKASQPMPIAVMIPAPPSSAPKPPLFRPASSGQPSSSTRASQPPSTCRLPQPVIRISHPAVVSAHPVLQVAPPSAPPNSQPLVVEDSQPAHQDSSVHESEQDLIAATCSDDYDDVVQERDVSSDDYNDEEDEPAQPATVATSSDDYGDDDIIRDALTSSLSPDNYDESVQGGEPKQAADRMDVDSATGPRQLDDLVPIDEALMDDGFDDIVPESESPEQLTQANTLPSPPSSPRMSPVRLGTSTAAAGSRATNGRTMRPVPVPPREAFISSPAAAIIASAESIGDPDSPARSLQAVSRSVPGQLAPSRQTTLVPEPGKEPLELRAASASSVRAVEDPSRKRTRATKPSLMLATADSQRVAVARSSRLPLQSQAEMLRKQVHAAIENVRARSSSVSSLASQTISEPLSAITNSPANSSPVAAVVGSAPFVTGAAKRREMRLLTPPPDEDALDSGEGVGVARVHRSSRAAVPEAFGVAPVSFAPHSAAGEPFMSTYADSGPDGAAQLASDDPPSTQSIPTESLGSSAQGTGGAAADASQSQSASASQPETTSSGADTPAVAAPVLTVAGEKRSFEDSSLDDDVAKKRSRVEGEDVAPNGGLAPSHEDERGRSQSPSVPIKNLIRSQESAAAAQDATTGDARASPSPSVSRSSPAPALAAPSTSTAAAASRNSREVVEGIRSSVYIADESKAELIRFVLDPEAYPAPAAAAGGADAGRLHARSMWAFELRRYPGEKKVGLLLIDMERRKYQTAGCAEATAATIDISQSLSQAEGDDMPPNLMSRDALEKALGAKCAQIATLEADKAALSARADEARRARAAEEEQTVFFQRMYQQASTAADERASETREAEAELARLRTALDAGLAQQRLAREGELDALKRDLQQAVAERDVQRECARRATSDGHVLRKAALWDEHVLRERALAVERQQQELDLAALRAHAHDDDDDDDDDDGSAAARAMARTRSVSASSDSSDESVQSLVIRGSYVGRADVRAMLASSARLSAQDEADSYVFACEWREREPQETHEALLQGSAGVSFCEAVLPTRMALYTHWLTEHVGARQATPEADE